MTHETFNSGGWPLVILGGLFLLGFAAHVLGQRALLWQPCLNRKRRFKT